MSLVPFSIFDPTSLDSFVDLQSVPPRRSIRPCSFTTKLRGSVPFDHLTVAGLNLPGFELGNGRSLDTEMPALLMDRYYDERLNGSDPLVSVCRKTGRSVTEQEAYDVQPPSNRLLELTRQFGVNHRILIPIQNGGPSYGGVGFSREEKFAEDELVHLELLAPSIYAAATSNLMKRFAAQQLGVIDGEKLCLQLASFGMTTQQISAESGFKPKTVDSYLKSAAIKLGTEGRLGAACEAMRRTLIH